MMVATMSEGLQHDVATPVTPVGSAGSPRPSFDEPTRIRHDQATLHLWGDDDAGRVADWIYVSSDKIHHLVFALPPGGMFRHSEGFRTVFAADEVLYVLTGTMVFIDPEHGEVRRVEAGEGVFFRRDTWHHAMSFGADQLRVLEFFAPPPATGTSSAYARTQDFLFDPRYHDDRWTGRWPMAADERARVARLLVLGSGDTLDSLEGEGAFVQTFASTEHLSVAKITIRPGGHSDTRRHGGDAAMHVLRGTLNVLLTDRADSNGRRWFELHSDDGFFVPEGTSYELRNVTADETQVMVGVAPSFAVD
jgi:mannose-6-phosphate isomerase-like protein (cupin superfamily)